MMEQRELPLDDPRLDLPGIVEVRGYQRKLPTRPQDGRPVARTADPTESHEAAASVAPGNGALCQAIREVVTDHGPQMAWTIAHLVQYRHPDRWQSDTIRTAIKRAGLVKIGTAHALPTGRAYGVYGLPGQEWP